ncbi:hypothetical protein Hoch_1213 [Haliangium ochraceum DSM 14365]|uniref:Uncharacterized protein n=1 Tax=Haliangium ochraceum (strain DSM 14365 / JCM 11303 / SMP-2) TaxID=502025 RepID=D0LS82_HALO1|nr:hypothetical protein Hoch_1213 [Haliangium ochraceum DSM 14365]
MRRIYLFYGIGLAFVCTISCAQVIGIEDLPEIAPRDAAVLDSPRLEDARPPPSGSEPDAESDASIVLIDASPKPIPPNRFPFDVAHLHQDDAWTGTATLTLVQGDIIDTSNLTVANTTYDGTEGDAIVFQPLSQLGGETEIAVLHVGSLTVNGGTVRASGHRPLVILAKTIRLTGLLDGSAAYTTPGAGGESPGQGPGAGSIGSSTEYYDGGGGGGSFGQTGGMGGSLGTDDSFPGLPGQTYGTPELFVLQGGSGGGEGFIGSSICSNALGGAGGGAIQLSAAQSINIESGGGILSSGGGGAGGIQCDEDGRNGAGAGGGSGGAIYLQAPAVVHTGILAANGGGGGGGSSRDGASNAGSNGVPSEERANGGQETGTFGGPGGCGGSRQGDPCDGENSHINSGGGGGGAGRIVIVSAPGGFSSEGTLSPNAIVLSE